MLDAADPFENWKLEPEKSLWNNLPNELFINIFGYLPHSDLEQIRLVCKHWHQITLLPVFMKKSKLIINYDTMSSLYTCFKDDVEMSSRLPCHTLELHGLQVSDHLRLILKSLGPKVRELRLYRSPVFNILNDCLPELEALIVPHISLPNPHKGFSIDFSKFKNLKSLDISSNLATTYLISSLERNMPLGLKKFCFELISGKEDFLIYTLQQYTNSLKHLQIMLSSRPSRLTKWKQVFASFRQLETLKIYGSYNDQWIKEVMECLPKESTLRNCGLIGGRKVNDSLLKLIVNKWSGSLESMELSLCTDLTDNGIKELGILRHNLKSLNVSCCPKVSHLGLLHGLATETNNILTTLTLTNESDMDALSVGLLAQRLPQLTYLSLKHCRESVNDCALEHIFRHQRKLQHLLLDGCIHITDKGILGFGLNPAPINNLKNLQTLSLMACRNLSNRALNGLNCNELHKLVLGHCNKITSRGIKELVGTCYALEDLTISKCLKIDDDAMIHIAHSLRKLRYLDVSNCSKLTGKSIAYVLESCKCLKELSLYNINSLEVQKVQDKCLQLKPRILRLNF